MNIGLVDPQLWDDLEAGRLNPLQWAIGGCPRSGTTYTAALLTNYGYKTPHEKVLRSVKGDHPPFLTISHSSESSWAVARWAGWLKNRGTTIVHVVRSPLNVFASMKRTTPIPLANDGNWFGQGVGDVVALEETGMWDRYAEFWIKWNELIEPYADFRWRTGFISARDLVEFRTHMGGDADYLRAGHAIDRTYAIAVTPKRPDGSPDYEMPSPLALSSRIHKRLLAKLEEYKLSYSQPHPPSEGGAYSIQPTK